MERNTISKILKEEKCYQEKYFDEKVYKITSFEKDINHIKYIYQAALSTSILQNIETKDYEKIIENLNQFKGNVVKTTTLLPLNHKGDMIIILSNPTETISLGILERKVNY